MAGSGAALRRFPVGLVCVLALAAFNLSFWLTRETVAQWDESLYASSAVEMVNSGDWVTTTYHGRPDYYNSKPPLNTCPFQNAHVLPEGPAT